MTGQDLIVFVGYDPREAEAFAVARNSIRRFNRYIKVHGVVLRPLQDSGIYYRPTTRRLGRLWDEISDAHMSTEFAISRFLVPQMARDLDVSGWAIFMDCDVLIRTNLTEMKFQLDDKYALCCVKHEHKPINIEKMDGQAQTVYPRKNWSSVMAFNLSHPSNDALTVQMVNSLPGRDLHRFCWLKDEEIGELPPEWNYLVGHTQGIASPKIVHFTEGGPWLEAFREIEFAGEWFAERDRWAK